MDRIIVVCAGGHGAVVADILQCARHEGEELTAIGFVDDTPELLGTTIAGLPVLGPISALPTIDHDAIVVAIGENSIRRTMMERLVADGERLAAAVHPRATVAATARIGEGVVISAGAIVQPGVTIGRGVILNTRCSVDHDSTVGDFAHLSPGATVGAHVHIGEEALIALGASVIARRRVGARTLIGAGAVVVRDIPDDVIAFGNPARIRSARAPELVAGLSPRP